MNNIISDKRKSMAALAVFRNLYNQKQDIYCVISEFIKLAIVENNLITFELSQISNIIKENNGIELPLAVIKQSLNYLKFLQKKNTTYTIDPDHKTYNIQSISEETLKKDKINQNIISQLYLFYSNKTNKELSNGEKEKLCNEFCAFIIDDTSSSAYGEYISEFIIQKSTNNEFVEQLNQIKQGVIIFTALSYNTNYKIDKIDSPIYIYLDTEIIFHMQGLNGPIYKNLFDEFYDLVTEINKRTKKEIIRLRYFSENEDEINIFFNIAERIIRKEERLDPTKQAMKNIINECKDASQVISLKATLFNTLKEKNILIDPQEKYYDKESNHKFIIDSNKFYNNITDNDITERDIDKKVNLLNYISIKRGNKCQKVFKNIGHILLSANKITFNIAFDNNIRKPDEVPLATNLSFLTNRFWLSLNKSLTNISSLQSINIITKAQIALSSKINDNVRKLYQQYLDEDKKGKYDTEKSKIYLAELYASTVDPSNLNAENTEDYTDILSINDINHYIAEKILIKEDNNRLKTENEKQGIIIDKAIDKILRDKNKEIRYKHLNELREYKKNKKKAILDLLKKEKYKNLKIIVVYLFAFIIIYLISCKALKYFNKNIFHHIISFVVEFIVFAIPFTLPFINFEKIKKAFKFFLQKKYKKELIKKYTKDYLTNNPPPILSPYSAEEIKKELESY